MKEFGYTIVKLTLPTGDVFLAIQRPKRSWWTGEIYPQYLKRSAYWERTTNLKKVERFYSVKEAEATVDFLKFKQKQRLKPVKVEVEKEC